MTACPVPKVGKRFNFIDPADGGVAQQQVASTVGTNGATLGLANIKAPKNGYAFVYISNRSDQDVYFDDFQVGIATGNIIEENHYYAYGLNIATISSKKSGDANEGTLKNNDLYNDKELFDDADLNWYDYGFRNYDPQIGRFMQLDPLTHYYPELTPFQFSGDDPIANVDMDGLEPASAINLVNKLASEGIKATMKVVEKGVYAGKWAVSWNTADGLAHVVPFATKTVGTAIAAASIIRGATNIIFAIRPMGIDNTASKCYCGPAYPKRIERSTKGEADFLSKLLDALDRLAMGRGGGNQAGGESLMKDAKEGDKSANIDVSGMTAEYIKIIDHANEILDMLGSGGGPEKGLARQVLDKNLTKAERVNAFIELMDKAYHMGDDLGEKIDRAIEKFKETREKTKTNSQTKPPIYKSVRKGRSNAKIIRTSGSNDTPDTIFIQKKN